ncbi:MAG: hypothetical protein GW839_04780 [Flavobacteriales bacterium]|nr:hypothetical protein [Flavobacteriia bacterium]NCP05633.1 hypothetical protein [Flavobacteriales bacterium]PIV94663.1 MAG: hypothetical protein COW44_02840 [Flavobacteriaceae bacterium CG17_big_fil_post_rev_8_21_14_2_50_33_15]PIY09681.1 MAG: hypothetical protein COZ17_12270 [Flavobacteriaceae bacterium CG_4_10_14_3_um_filter_33_47]PJB16567.1 MAG: hypothetical protein CO117_14805 [Flavobacteriaceae bacterium CG_4_9_14_3_um_filter_33_16]
MKKSKVMVGLVLLVYLGFIVFQFSNNKFWAEVLDALLLPLITIAYFKNVNKPNLYFAIFLICYSVSDLMVFIVDYIPYLYYYFIGNGLYIFAYIALLIKILQTISFSHIVKHFKLHIVVLLALNIYIAYVLQIIVNPYMVMTNEYVIEITYNISMLLVLTSSLLSYLYRDDRKSLLMFLGSLSIVFSEVIGVAYLYVAQQNLLSFLTTSLTLLAFYFYCKQSSLVNEEVNQFAS